MVVATTSAGAITCSEVNDDVSTLLKCLVPSPKVEPATSNKQNITRNLLL
jgi:hypothetical protein